MPSTYQPRRPRASPLWQLVHHGWAAFLAHYEKRYRKDLGPLHPAATATVESFLRCGDLASGFTRLQCSDCGHERLLAFTCKGRHFCPSCHQRRVRSTSDWIATAVCHEVPHRQFVFTIPKVLRGIFRKRRQLLTHLFHTATETLRDTFFADNARRLHTEPYVWNRKDITEFCRQKAAKKPPKPPPTPSRRQPTTGENPGSILT